MAGLREKSRWSRGEILLRSLELLGEYYRFDDKQKPMELELRRLEKEAFDHMERLRRIDRKDEAIREFVREIRFTEEIIDKYCSDKSMLIQILLEVQEHKNWLSKPALLWISERLDVPMSLIRHIASFYTALSMEPQGRHTCQVCMGTACHVRGSDNLLARVKEVLYAQPGETNSEQKFTLKTVNCLGCCAMGPVMTVDGDYYSDPHVKELRKLAETYE